MNLTRKLIFTAALAALPFSALAQNVTDIVDRNGDQQRRIEQGLRSGDLTVQEAARLESEASRINRMESRALSDGNLNNAERARIDSAQDRFSQNIARERHDREMGNPNSPSSLRMQADVQRNVNQQERIEQGIRSGDLNNREVSRLEHGQARTTRMEARAGADGRIDRNEQRHIQGADHRQSRQIYGERHDDQFRRGGDHRQAYDNHRDDRFRRGGDHGQSYGHRRDGDHSQSYDHRRDAQAPRGSEHRQAWGNQRDVQVPRAGDNRQSNGNPRDVQAPRAGDNRQASGVRQNGDFRGGTQPRAQQQPRVQPQQPRHVAQAGGRPAR